VRALPSDNRHWSVLEQLPIRDKVFFFEAVIKEHPLALGAADFPVFHHFSPGRYRRELRVPKGMIIIGKIHKYPCKNYLEEGDMSVLVGDKIVRKPAPYGSTSPAGTKRIAYTHEDSIWITTHETTETDIEKLERDLTAESEQEYQEFCRIAADEARKCLS
jgi:hypothetical protein